MAHIILFALAALVVQECSGVPVVLPSSIFPSLTLTDIPLPTGARLDVHHHSFPFSLPPLPTGGANVARNEEDLPLPTDLPSLTAISSLPSLTAITSLLSLTDITSLLPLPTSEVGFKRENEDLPLPTDLPSLTISLPSLTSISSLPGLTSLPTLPSLTSTPTLPSLTISIEQKRQDTGLPSEIQTPPALPTGVPTGIPSGFPTRLPLPPPPPPPTASTLRVVPGGLLRPGRA